MTLQQQYNAAYARARANEACAAVVGVEILSVGIPASIKDKDAYRDEIRMIANDLNDRVTDHDWQAEILRPT